MLALAAAAADYRSFEAIVLRKSPAIEALKLGLEEAKVRGEIVVRYDNPELEMEASRFNPDKGESDDGWRATLSQPLRVFGLGSELQSYARALRRTTEAQTLDARNRFLLGLRSRYLDWVRSERIAALAAESVKLAKRLETSAKKRFESGAGTNAKAMQARLEALGARTEAAEDRRQARRSGGELLAFAGVADLPLPDLNFSTTARTTI